MTTYERAIQIYQVLIAAAHQRQTITYTILGKLIGVPQQGVGNHLEHIQQYCVSNDLPPITVLVVRKGSGKPGSGLTAAEDVDSERERVYAHAWFHMKPVTVKMLQQAGKVS
jgi:hypothetical protein